jgi:putative tricarboxylic transport membrane protein
MSLLPRTIVLSAAVALVAAGCGSNNDTATPTAGGGSWEPSQPIEVVAPANTGGGWDTFARTASRVLGDTGIASVPMPVVNQPGGGGAIGWAYMARNAGDPHKLFVTSPPIILVPLSGQSQHDHSDFTPIARLITDYMIYAVAADSPYQTIEDLFDAMRQDPRALSVAGGSAPGSMDHIALAGAADAAGIEAREVNYIPFSGGGEALTALLGGHVDAVVTGVGESQAQVEAGAVRVLAVSGEERAETLPDVPTLKESGVEFDFDIWRGVMGPADLDEAQVAHHEGMFEQMVATDEWVTERERLGWSDSWAGSEDFSTFLDEQQALFESVLDDLGLLRQ